MRDLNRSVKSVLLGMSLISVPALAGQGTGNGGGAVVCIGSQGELKAELLDLWEAEHDPAPRLTFLPSQAFAGQLLEEALQKLAKADPLRVAAMREVLVSLAAPGKTRALEQDLRLPPPTDTRLGLLSMDRNCSLQGVANFDDSSGDLTYDPVLFAAMSPRDQAALSFHEALYKAERLGPGAVHTSIQARKLTAAVFSAAPLSMIPITQGLNTATYECDAQGDFHFFIIPQESGKTRLQFSKIDRRELTDLTYVDLDPRAGGDESLIAARAATGFKQVVYPMPYSTQLPAPKALLTTSQFEPAYPITLQVSDTATGSGSSKHYVSNGWVALLMNGDSRYQPFGAWGVHCTKK